MAAIKLKERLLMSYLESVISRYAFAKEPMNTDVCRKPELRILEIVGKHGPLMMTDIAERAVLSLSAVTGIVDGLVEKALVKRERPDDDRRVVQIRLTRDGKKVFQEILQFRLRIVRGMLSPLNTEEQNTLIGLFRKMVERIMQEEIPVI